MIKMMMGGVFIAAAAACLAAPAVAQADDEMDDLFVTTVQKAHPAVWGRLSAPDLIDAGRLVCTQRQAGLSDLQVVQQMDKSGLTDWGANGFLVGASKVAYCPWFK